LACNWAATRAPAPDQLQLRLLQEKESRADLEATSNSINGKIAFIPLPIPFSHLFLMSSAPTQKPPPIPPNRQLSSSSPVSPSLRLSNDAAPSKTPPPIPPKRTTSLSLSLSVVAETKTSETSAESKVFWQLCSSRMF
jgi:hypothetical protein